MLAREIGLGPLLVRLGVVAGCLLAIVVLVVQGRHLLTAHAPVDSIRAGPTALDRQTTKSASSTPLVRAFAAQSRSPADNAAPDMRARFDAGFAIQPADYVEAARLMIPPPPQTEPGLQGVDPRFLRNNFQRGVTAMNGDVEDQITSGARLVSVAAIFGYKPARALIAQRYPSSSVIRSAVTSTEAIRYSLDPLVISGAKSEGNRNFLVLLAAYFSGHQALSNYAADLLAALGDDQRLQTGERLELLLHLLARVRGACTAIAMAVVKGRTSTGPECSSGLQSQLANYLNATPPPGLEAESRRQGLQLLANAGDIAHPLVQSPVGD